MTKKVAVGMPGKLLACDWPRLFSSADPTQTEVRWLSEKPIVFLRSYYLGAFSRLLPQTRQMFSAHAAGMAEPMCITWGREHFLRHI